MKSRSPQRVPPASGTAGCDRRPEPPAAGPCKLGARSANNVSMETRRFAELTATVVGGTDRAGGGDGPVVVLLHGFGAPGTDLVPLWRQLDIPANVRFVFPEAPIDLAATVGNQMAPPGSRAWWMLDLAALESALRGGERPDRSGEIPEGLPAAREAVLRCLEAVDAELGPPPGQIILGGFSQGAMLALDVALHTDRALSGLVLMSATLIAQSEWTRRMSARAGLAVVQSHGRSDPLLPFGAAERLRDLMIEAGMRVRWVEFNGGHTIPDSALDAISEMVREAWESER